MLFLRENAAASVTAVSGALLTSLPPPPCLTICHVFQPLPARVAARWVAWRGVNKLAVSERCDNFGKLIMITR